LVKKGILFPTESSFVVDGVAGRLTWVKKSGPSGAGVDVADENDADSFLSSSFAFPNFRSKYSNTSGDIICDFGGGASSANRWARRFFQLSAKASSTLTFPVV